MADRGSSALGPPHVGFIDFGFVPLGFSKDIRRLRDSADMDSRVFNAAAISNANMTTSPECNESSLVSLQEAEAVAKPAFRILDVVKDYVGNPELGELTVLVGERVLLLHVSAPTATPSTAQASTSSLGPDSMSSVCDPLVLVLKSAGKVSDDPRVSPDGADKDAQGLVPLSCLRFC